MSNHDRELIEEAFRSSCPAEGLLQVVTALASQKREQADIYCMLEVMLESLPEDSELQDVVADTMDKVWGGGWGGQPALFEASLTDEVVSAARLRYRPL